MVTRNQEKARTYTKGNGTVVYVGGKRICVIENVRYRRVILAGQWRQIAIDSKLFLNVRESALRKATAAMENCFPNEAGGVTRFPGLVPFCTLAGAAPTYLHEWQGDLIAASNSRVYRIDRSGTKTDVTGVPLSGEGRCVFSETEEELLLASGGPILRLANEQTEILSPDAPDSTHIGYVDGFVLAVETDTQRFFHSNADSYRQWDPLSVFSANGSPDNINALVVTPYREVILTGQKSTEQFERLFSGNTPFFRRWSVGQGIIAPYTVLAEDQGVWAVNSDLEFVRFTGQTSEPNSDDVGRSFAEIDDWTGAWAASAKIVGQKFIILQMPNATNIYGSKGVTLIYEFRQKKWFSLYGWNNGEPARWPGWSYYRLWGRHFVGGDGEVLELTESTYQNDGVTQRMLGRTAHIDEWGSSRIDNVRVRLKRGIGGPSATSAKFGLRVLRDNKRYTRWHYKDFGIAGDTDMILEFGPMGFATTWQFEYSVTDDVQVDLVSMQAQVSPAEQS